MALSRRSCFACLSSSGDFFFLGPKSLSLADLALVLSLFQPRLIFPPTFLSAAISFWPIFWAIALILPAIFLAAPAILRSRNELTNSITATAAAASAWANGGPALPDLTAFRKATKRSIAAMIRWIAPQA